MQKHSRALSHHDCVRESVTDPTSMDATGTATQPLMTVLILEQLLQIDSKCSASPRKQYEATP